MGTLQKQKPLLPGHAETPGGKSSRKKNSAPVADDSQDQDLNSSEQEEENRSVRQRAVKEREKKPA
jgi:hypothetical protein